MLFQVITMALLLLSAVALPVIAVGTAVES
jgi:hypothetical protein